jgi:cytochrome c-type biogenesis protein CcmH
VLWVVTLVAIGLCLAVGSGAIGSGHGKAPTLYQRTMQVAGEYRCPVCAGESAAVSDAPEAVEIRQLIQGWLEKGDSQATIRSFLVHDYGLFILEKPPASGVGALVWILPAVAGLLAVIGLGLGFSRWRRASLVLAGAERSFGAQAVVVSPVPLVSGQLPVQERLFDVPGAEGSGAVATPKRPARPLRQRVTLVAGAALVLLAGALWLVDRSSSTRLPGATITGGFSGVNADLQEASALTATDPTEALTLYDQVLSSDPDQPVALTSVGWIYAQAGIVSKSMTLLEQAEAADPGYDLPHLYRALVLLDDEDQVAAAGRELEWYLAHGPDPAMVKVAKEALADAKSSVVGRSSGSGRSSAKKLPPKS